MQLEEHARVSLKCFLISISLVIPGQLGLFLDTLIPETWPYFAACFVIHGVMLNALLYVIYTGNVYRNAVRASGLGVAFAVGLLISQSGGCSAQFGWYLCALAFFHWSEYFWTAATNPRSLTLSSYLLDHSLAYHLAAYASWCEFWLEWWLDVKGFHWLCYCGLALIISGEALRKMAMWTAATNFNHYVQSVRRPDHELVTRGVYALCRHPSYLGWFMWSVGTQLVLLNPACLLAYTYISWRFFRDRIEDEEIKLIRFFGAAYIDYQQKVPTGIPGIRGFILDR